MVLENLLVSHALLALALMTTWPQRALTANIHGVFLSDEATTYDEIPSDCTPVSPRVFPDAFLQHTQDSNPGVNVWLPLKRLPINGSRWIWLNGKYYAERLSDPAWHQDGMDCAVLRAGDNIIDDDFCNKPHFMYMCESESKPCVTEQGKVACIKHQGMIYSIHMQPGSWYQALQRCQAMGLKLASLADKQDAILAKIPDQIQEYTHPNIWLGLRMKEYQWTNGSAAEQFFWDEGSLCACPLLNCTAIFKESDRKVVWKQQHCNHDRNHHLCLSSKRTSLTNPFVFVLPGVLSAIAFMIVAIGIILIMKFALPWRQRKKLAENQNAPSKRKSNVEKHKIAFHHDPTIVNIGAKTFDQLPDGIKEESLLESSGLLQDAQMAKCESEDDDKITDAPGPEAKRTCANATRDFGNPVPEPVSSEKPARHQTLKCTEVYPAVSIEPVSTKAPDGEEGVPSQKIHFQTDKRPSLTANDLRHKLNSKRSSKLPSNDLRHKLNLQRSTKDETIRPEPV